MTVLFDTGASHSFTSLAVLERLGGVPRGDRVPLALARAGGGAAEELAVAATLQLGLGKDFVCALPVLAVPDIGAYDVLVGKPWFAAMGAELSINFSTHWMRVGASSWRAAAFEAVPAAQVQFQAKVLGVGLHELAPPGARGNAAEKELAPTPRASVPAEPAAPRTSAPPGDTDTGLAAPPAEAGLAEVQAFLLTAKQGARELRKPGTAYGVVFPRLVPRAGGTEARRVGPDFSVGIGAGMLGEEQSGQPERVEVERAAGASLWERGLRFGNDGKAEPSVEMRAMLQRYENVMPVALPKQVPQDRGAPHVIQTLPGSSPPARPPIRLSPPQYVELQKQLQLLLDHGFIRPSTSPYAAPVFFVQRPREAKMRLVADWRGLNAITVKNKLALPNLEELFDQLAAATTFSKLDLASGFNRRRHAQQMCGDLWLANFFRRFVAGFAEIAAPLNDLLAGGVAFAWGAKEQAAFAALKAALVAPPALALPRWHLPFVVTANASDVGIAAVLQLEGRAVAFYSGKLAPAEQRYGIEDKEALACVRACLTWRHYLFNHFVLRTDSQVVRHLMSKAGVLSRRQQHWVTALADFDFSIELIASEDNVADGLSRRPDVRATAQVEPLQAGPQEGEGARLEEVTGRDAIPTAQAMVLSALT